MLLVPTDAKQSLVIGKLINGTIKAGKIEKARVIAIDRNGNARANGGDRVTAFTINLETGKAQKVEVYDEMVGSYELSLKIQ